MKPKTIKMQFAQWKKVYDLAVELTRERGSTVTVPAAIAEAVKFYRENRKKPDA